MTFFEQDPSIIEQAEEEILHLEKLLDKAYLHGVSQPLTKLQQLKRTPEFLEIKEAVRAMDTQTCTMYKTLYKGKHAIWSLSDHHLAAGQDCIKTIMREMYDVEKEALHSVPMDNAMKRHLPLLTVPKKFQYIEINRQDGNITTLTDMLEVTHSVAERSMNIKTVQKPMMDFKMGLLTGVDGLSGEMAERIKEALLKARAQVEELIHQPAAVHAFEQATKMGHSLHR